MPTHDEIRAFAGRRWDLARREKLRFLADRFREGGPEASWKAAQLMRARWFRLHPKGSPPAARAADLAAHVALKANLDRTAGAVGRR